MYYKAQKLTNNLQQMRKFVFSAIAMAAMAFTSQAQVTQDFESNDRTAIRNNCWIIWGFSPNANGAIAGSYSARSQQLTNANDSAQLVSPYTMFDGTGNITFSHKLDGNNGTERVLHVALFDQNGDFVQNLQSYTYRSGNTALTGDATQSVSGSIAVTFSGVYRIGFYATGSGGASRVVLDDVSLPGVISADAGNSDGFGNCAPIVPAVVSQDFESGNRNAVRSDCWTIFGYDVKSNSAITGGFSARSQQLSNVNDSATFISPFINFNGTGTITFSHKLDGNNGNERALYVDLLDVNGNKVQNLLSYVYRTGNTSLVGDATVAAMANIPVNFSGDYKIAIYATGSQGASRNLIDDVMISGTNVADENCGLIGAKEYTSSIVSDANWALSTAVTTATANSYPWPGAGSVPAANTFTKPVVLEQPYGFVSISTVDGSEVIKSESGVTYYRKEFNLSENTGINVRFRMFVDDNMQIFINGQSVALEDGMGVVNFRTANHDLLIKDDNSIVNGNAGGDAFDFVTTITMDNIFQVGVNDIILAIRNRTSKPDLGGFSFRMDIDKNGNNVIEKSGEATAPVVSTNPSALNADIYPNPTNGIINIVPSHLDLSKDVEVLIYDMSGHVVISKSYTYTNIGELLTMKLDGLAKGVYSIKVTNGAESLVKCVVLN